MRKLSPIGLLLILIACGFPRPADVGGDASGDIRGDDASTDAPDEPGTVIRVSPTGDDANDGLVTPVKTLKRAIGLAAENNQLAKIVLAGGRYSVALGETFPYTVPANVTIVGPAGGGAILMGSKAEPGMIVDSGTLQNLELEDFTVAVTAVGPAYLTNIRVRTEMLALRAETAAKLTVDNLDITGKTAACASGIVLIGAAELAATSLATRNLGTTLDAKDRSQVSITRSNIAGDPGCLKTLITVTSNRIFAVTDTVIDGGNTGITINPTSPALQVRITNTILRNLKENALGGGALTGHALDFRMVGGEMANNGRGGAEFGTGSWTFTNVAIRQNAAFGIYLQGGTLVMRNCVVTDNGSGVYLLFPVAVDLGTVVDPGRNVLQRNSGQSLDYDSSRIQVEAVGNTWNPGVQDADDLGTYRTPEILQGHVGRASYNNYSIICDPGQCTLHR